MAHMDTQLKTMQDMHVRMVAAKTPTERSSLMAEQMKVMQDSMAMMNAMSEHNMAAMHAGMHAGMHEGMKTGMAGGMSGEMPGAMAGGMQGGMAAHHQLMEKRMQMMEAMMQMLMDRMAAGG